MKTILKGLLCLALLTSTFSNAQDEDNPWVVTFGVNAVDTYPTNSTNNLTGGAESGKWFDNFYNTSHWNMSPSISFIGLSRHITEGFSFAGRMSLTRISKFGNVESSEMLYRSFDMVIRNSLAKKGATWNPFVEVGSAYTKIGDNANFGFNLGGGIAYWSNDNFGFSYQANYKNSVDESGADHFQHLFGMNVKFGGIDTDGDGVYDKHDACPEVPGLEEFAGCPDTDGDGITDKEDTCPNRAGSAAMGGCPDSDGDGLSDIEDACPNRAGSASMGGCPDTDADGINDLDDACPEEYGPAENNGCPWADGDGDGIADKDDACPELAGVAENNGCPKLPEDVIEALNLEGTMIRFNAESAEILGKDSFSVIAKIKGILESYPTVNFVVEGHASSDGSKGYNMKLSESRAAAVKAALVENGADAARISTAAFGEDKPIRDNNTAKGRKINRRVQFAIGGE